MNAAELRAIAAKNQSSGRQLPSSLPSSSLPTGMRRLRRWISNSLYYGLLGFCGLMAFGAVGVMLESPEARDARYAEQARQEQVRAIEQHKAELEAAKQEKEDARLARLESCTKMQNFAYPASKNEVRARLKSPSTASFPWTPILSQHTGNCKFQVLAYVDAQNGFGAMIRSRYIATLTYDPANERWRVTSVKLEN